MNTMNSHIKLLRGIHILHMGKKVYIVMQPDKTDEVSKEAWRIFTEEANRDRKRTRRGVRREDTSDPVATP